MEASQARATPWRAVQPNSAELVFKVLVTGDPCVGKTSLVSITAHGKVIAQYKPTLGGEP